MSVAVYASGDLEYTGNLIGPPSDSRLKKNKRDLDGALETIMSLQAKSFEYQREAFDKMNLPKGKHYGFMAEEMKNVLPELVKDRAFLANPPNPATKEGSIETPYFVKGINYVELIPILARAIQEQQALIEDQAEALEDMSAKYGLLLREVDNLKSRK